MEGIDYGAADIRATTPYKGTGNGLTRLDFMV
jgi:hypothetical protein